MCYLSIRPETSNLNRMKKYQKVILVIALPLALFFFSEKFFWFNYQIMMQAGTILNTYETGDNRTDNN